MELLYYDLRDRAVRSLTQQSSNLKYDEINILVLRFFYSWKQPFILIFQVNVSSKLEERKLHPILLPANCVKPEGS